LPYFSFALLNTPLYNKPNAHTNNMPDKSKTKNYKFFAFVNRLKLINRWSLMHNRQLESVAEHSHQSAIIAHSLALIDNEVFAIKTDANKAAVYALFHDASEVFTGDIPTPVKYRNAAMVNAYDEAAVAAEKQLLDSLPKNFRPLYKDILRPKITESREAALAYYADKICALIKCTEEVAGGNKEFLHAKKSTLKKIEELNDNSVNCFLEYFLPAFSCNLDELIAE